MKTFRSIAAVFALALVFAVSGGFAQTTTTTAAPAKIGIVNTQAFAASLKEGGRSKESRIIYSRRDEFGSRRPIDVIAANRPIVIMDEPQKMEGEATQTGLKRFMPLFVLNYSATHKTKHNTVYALDALDAYQKKLVKRLRQRSTERWRRLKRKRRGSLAGWAVASISVECILCMADDDQCYEKEKT